MSEVFRIFECRHGVLCEIAFVLGEQSTQFYLTSCNLHNIQEDVFYFAEKITIER